MTASGKGPSLLLKHIHYSLPALVQIYEQHVVRGSATAALTKLKLPPAAAFPTEPTTEEEGKRVLRFFCEELGMDMGALSTWRCQLHEAINRRWGSIPSSASDGVGVASTAPRVTLSSSPEAILVQQGLEDEIFANPQSAASVNARRDQKLWWMPRATDAAFINSCRSDLKAVISPFVSLSPPGCFTQSAALDAAQSSPRAHAQTSRFYATKPIPAGMFVLSLPTEAAFFADPPPATDPLLRYFMHVEDLVGQLLAVSDDPMASHFGYVQYLKETVVPVRNLPFLMSREEVTKLLEMPATTETQAMGGSSLEPSPPSTFPVGSPEKPAEKRMSPADSSPALALWDFFHQDMKGEPLSPYVREKLHFSSAIASGGGEANVALPLSSPAIGKAEYAWWVSLVLSRREGAATLIPLVDKLNHSPLPNTYYTMSTPSSFCGIDVLDNLLAGVPLEFLYQPYVHVFTIREVQPGEELTLCYASAPDSAYRVRSRAESTSPKPYFGNEGLAEELAAVQPQDESNDKDTIRRRLEPRGCRRQEALYEQAFSELFEEKTGETTTGDDLRWSRGFHLSARRHLHPGPQLVQTPEGKAIWQLQWGFVPPVDAVYSASDLREMGALVAERRVDSRGVLFPPLTKRRKSKL